MSELKERILLIAKKRLIGQKAMEKECGLSSGFINKISDKTGVNSVRKIIETYSINSHWLITGEGEMFAPNQINVINDTIEPKEIEELKKKIDLLEGKCEKLNRENGVLEGRICELAKNNPNTYPSSYSVDVRDPVLHESSEKNR